MTIPVLVNYGLKSRRDTDQRLKLLGATLNTYAFGLLGGAAGAPLLKHVGFSPVHAAALCFGLACHAVALYLAPRGVQHDA